MKLHFPKDWLTRQPDHEEPDCMVWACNPEYLKKYPNSLIAQMVRIDLVQYLVRVLEAVRNKKQHG